MRRLARRSPFVPFVRVITLWLGMLGLVVGTLIRSIGLGDAD
jgi:hypothetical protein